MARAALDVGRAPRRGDRGRQRLRGRQRRAGPRRPARRVVTRAPPRLRQRLPRRLRRRARPLHRDGRRRPHLRLQRDPALRRASSRRAPTSWWATGWTTSSPARCRGCTATWATRCSRGVLNLFYRTGVNDAHCGMRAVRRDVLPRLDLRTTGMEFASEMVIRAAKENLEIRQFPIEYHPRGGDSKLDELPRRLAPPALPARAQPHPPVRDPGR